jgi:hypothetical protein
VLRQQKQHRKTNNKGHFDLILPKPVRYPAHHDLRAVEPRTVHGLHERVHGGLARASGPARPVQFTPRDRITRRSAALACRARRAVPAAFGPHPSRAATRRCIQAAPSVHPNTICGNLKSFKHAIFKCSVATRAAGGRTRPTLPYASRRRWLASRRPLAYCRSRALLRLDLSEPPIPYVSNASSAPGNTIATSTTSVDTHPRSPRASNSPLARTRTASENRFAD